MEMYINTLRGFAENFDEMFLEALRKAKQLTDLKWGNTFNW